MKRFSLFFLSVFLLFLAYKSYRVNTDDSMEAMVLCLICGIVGLYLSISGKDLPKGVYHHPQINHENDINNIPFKIYFPIIIVSLFIVFILSLYVRH